MVPILLTLHFLLVSPLRAETSLGLDGLVREALEKNAELKAAKSEVAIKESQEGPKGAYDDPMLSFEMMNYPVDTLKSGEFGMTGNEIALSQKIPFPGKLSKLRASSEAETESEKQKLEMKRLEIAKNVKLVYFSLFLDYKRLSILNDEKNLFTQLTAIARNKYTVGKGTLAEVLNMQLEEANIIDQILIAEKQVESNLGELNHLLGREDHSQYVSVKPEELKKTPFDFALHSEKDTSERILAHNPTLKSNAALLKASETKVSYANWNYFPDLELKAGYTFRKPSPGDRGVDFVSGMVGVSLPIWGRQSDEKRGAQAEKIRAEAMNSEARIEFMHRVHVLYTELLESSKRIALFEEGILPLTKEAVSSAKSSYLTGKIEYSTLLSLINKRFQMEIAYYEALVMHESRLSELEALSGGTLGAA